MTWYLLTEFGERLVQESGGALILDQEPARLATFPRRATQIYLAEIQAYDPDSTSVITWYFSSGQGFNNAGTFYVPRIENPATFSRSMSGALGGKVSGSYGELTLINPDGALDAVGNDYFDGRTLTLKFGDKDGSYASFQTILTATIESVALESDRISVRLRDRSSVLDTPFSEAKYGGTNTLPTGVDGTPDDLKDKPKPRIFGRIALMSPVLVNTSKLIYQVNNGAVDSIVNVYDGGAYLTRSSDYLNLSDLYTYDPPEGTFRSLPSLGLFRLGSTPVGQLSVCVVEEWDYISNTAAGLIQRILTEVGFTASDWVAADFTTLNQKNAGSLGLIVQDSETTASLIDRICASVGAWYGFDALGKFRFGRFDAPEAPALVTIGDNIIIDCERQPEGQLPYWRTTMAVDTNYLVQDKNSLAGVVPEYRASWFGLTTRDQKAENAAIKNTRLLAQEVQYDSSLNGLSIAQAEAARRLNLFAVRRDVVNLTVSNPLGYSIELGDVINLQSEQLGYGLGRLMTVTSIRIDYQANTLDLILWG